MNNRILSIICMLSLLTTLPAYGNSKREKNPVGDAEELKKAELAERMRLKCSNDTYTDIFGMVYCRDPLKFRTVDKRKVKTANSPAYLDAVGRLEITTAEGVTSGCAAFLVSTLPGA